MSDLDRQQYVVTGRSLRPDAAPFVSANGQPTVQRHPRVDDQPGVYSSCPHMGQWSAVVNVGDSTRLSPVMEFRQPVKSPVVVGQPSMVSVNLSLWSMVWTLVSRWYTSRQQVVEDNVRVVIVNSAVTEVIMVETVQTAVPMAVARIVPVAPAVMVVTPVVTVSMVTRANSRRKTSQWINLENSP